MKNVLSLATLAFLTLGLTGCGGGGGGGTVIVDDTLTGTFVDAPVQGLKYETATQSGYTDESGQFKYKSGEIVTFKIGNIEIGSAAGNKNITPLTLSGDTNINSISTKATNIARILQSLDDNTSDITKITLPQSLSDMNLSNISFTDEADLNTILSEAQNKTSKTYILKDAVSAKNTMKNYLQTYLFNGSYTGVYTLTGGTYYSNTSVCATRTATFYLTVTNGTTITGYTSHTPLGVYTITGTLSGNNATASTSNPYVDVLNATVDENGNIVGTYNFYYGRCTGTFVGTKNN